MKNYLRRIEKFKQKQKAFVLITAGRHDESGFAINQCKRLLNKLNCEIIYSEVIEMPINWTTSPKPPFPPPKDVAKEIIQKGVIRAKEIAHDILNGVQKHHKFSYPKRYLILKFYLDYLMFKYLGLQNMWRLFDVYSICNGCQLCARICPTNSIQLINKRPVWSKTCEQCMRCVNFCPQESIFQGGGGSTTGKNKYHEPGFNPKHTI